MGTSANMRVSILPNLFETDLEWKRKMNLWMAEAAQGHINNAGNVSLISGTVSTVVSDNRVGAFSFVGLMPRTANAASEIGNGTLYIASQSKGAFTITHANAATGDRTFKYCILG